MLGRIPLPPHTHPAYASDLALSHLLIAILGAPYMQAFQCPFSSNSYLLGSARDNDSLLAWG